MYMYRVRQLVYDYIQYVYMDWYVFVYGLGGMELASHWMQSEASRYVTRPLTQGVAVCTWRCLIMRHPQPPTL